MGLLEGSIGAFQIRMWLPDEYADMAGQMVVDAQCGFGRPWPRNGYEVD